MTNQKATGERKMTDRDHFAAAALTGLIVAMRDESMSEVCESAYDLADAMLRERRQTNHDAAPAATAVSDEARTDKAATSHRRDRPRDTLSEAEIDALECVVEDGRIVGMSAYGRLRSLLVRLRPEWKDESYENTDEKRGDSDANRAARIAAIEELAALAKLTPHERKLLGL